MQRQHDVNWQYLKDMVESVQEAVQRQGKQIADNHDGIIEIEKKIKDTVEIRRSEAFV